LGDRGICKRERIDVPLLPVSVLIELAEEMDKEDPIDWGMLPIKEKDAYKIVAESIAEIYNNAPEEKREIILLSSLMRMSVQNFVLHAHDLQRRN